MKWLLNLYPRAWRRRYRQEVEAQLELEKLTIRTVLDLMAGAADAWVNPEWIPEVRETGGGDTMITASRCGSTHFSKAEALRSAFWMLGVTIVLSGTAVGLTKTYGSNIMTSALLYAAFFIAFTVSSRHTYLKPYSQRARNVLTFAGIIGWYLFFLAAAALAAKI